MLHLLKRLFGDPHREADTPPPPAGSGIVAIDDGAFDFAADARWHDGVPHPDWAAARSWHDALPASRRAEAWLALERGWLDWLRGSLGLHYRIHESPTALLLSTQPPRLARVQLGYLDATLRRIERTLEEIADHAAVGKEILIACADEDDYYRYVSGFYPEEGDFAMSAGMHLDDGCGHFVTHGLELSDIEPTIVHEMTHSCVAHLPIPLWLNEGLAQSVEHRFAPTPQDPLEQIALRRRQRDFWSVDSIQQFWTGASFQRTDEARALSYDMGLALTEALAQDWPRFKSFVRAAQRADAGAAAAHDALGIDLGEAARLFLERPEGELWSPRPSHWPLLREHVDDDGDARADRAPPGLRAR
jgi:hypothetical protein